MPLAMSEPEWRAFRALSEIALERFCERALSEMSRAASQKGETNHQRYLRVWRIMKTRDRELASTFNNPRRSDAVRQLADMRSLNLVTEEEMAMFAPATRNSVGLILDLRKQ